uniref:(northern house mosquito) hypothetical protein n=1 Tax=Culex pipiens TaxID=7175 RepID=A0A8D8GC14_CULPI
MRGQLPSLARGRSSVERGSWSSWLAVARVWVVLGWIALLLLGRVVMVHHWPRTRIRVRLLLLLRRRLRLVVMEVRLNWLVVSVVFGWLRHLRPVDPEHNVDAIVKRGSLGRVSPFGTFQHHVLRTVVSVRLGVHVVVRGTFAESLRGSRRRRRRRLPLLTLQLGIANRRIGHALLVAGHWTLIVGLTTPAGTCNDVDLILARRFLLRRRRSLVERWR